MESSERVKMLEKQRCRAGCVNPCERNTLWSDQNQRKPGESCGTFEKSTLRPDTWLSAVR